MKTFEIGKTYTTRSAGDHNCIWSFTITARTAATVTAVDDQGAEKKYRINKRLTACRDAETILPLGNYSMCPVLSAQ